jgi:hypothetical protein
VAFDQFADSASNMSVNPWRGPTLNLGRTHENGR